MNLMNNAHKAHTEASRANHEETFGHKCHWHGCRNAVVKKDGLWLCQSCLRELMAIAEAQAQPDTPRTADTPAEPPAA